MAPMKDTAMERVLPKLPGDGSGGGWWEELWACLAGAALALSDIELP